MKSRKAANSRNEEAGIGKYLFTRQMTKLIDYSDEVRFIKEQ